MRFGKYLAIFVVAIVAINIGYGFLLMLKPEHLVIDDFYKFVRWPIERISLGLWTGLAVFCVLRKQVTKAWIAIVAVLLAGSLNMIGRTWRNVAFSSDYLGDLLLFNAVFGAGVAIAIFSMKWVRERMLEFSGGNT